MIQSAFEINSFLRSSIPMVGLEYRREEGKRLPYDGIISENLFHH